MNRAYGWVDDFMPIVFALLCYVLVSGLCKYQRWAHMNEGGQGERRKGMANGSREEEDIRR
jgi:hypothetical protein